jgi:Ca2+-binding RTX toxin-like protein
LAGKHAIIGSADDDMLAGTSGDDLINGGDGNDRLSGSNGYDDLIGGPGTDTLVGGGDADMFIPEAEVSSPLLADQIVDFNRLESDKIELANGLEFDDLVLQAFDSDSNGIADATSIRVGPNSDDPVVAVALGTVDIAGQTTLTSGDFTSA